MKKLFKLSFLALTISLSVAACNSNKPAETSADSVAVDSTIVDSMAVTDTAAVDTTVAK